MVWSGRMKVSELIRKKKEGKDSEIPTFEVTPQILQEYCKEHNIKSFRDDHKGMPYDENDWVKYNLPDRRTSH